MVRYKVGDKVKIKSLDWYETNRKGSNSIWSTDKRDTFTYTMSKFCSQIATIESVDSDCECYTLDIDDQTYIWYDWMFEEDNIETKEIILPKGWEIDKIENGKIVLKESKKKLPKTWEECYMMLGKGEFIDRDSGKTVSCKLTNPQSSVRAILPEGLGKPMLALHQLLICREVYRQGWKPNWNNLEPKYCIELISNHLDVIVYTNTVRTFSFQSREIAEEFFSNFRKMLESIGDLI